LLLYSSHLALGVFNWPVIYFINYTPTSSLTLFITAPSTSFFGAVAGEERRLLQGEFLHAHPLLCFKFCFTLFLLASFYQKRKKFSILYSCYFFTLVHYVVP
jgi:hypothetical protein